MWRNGKPDQIQDNAEKKTKTSLCKYINCKIVKKIKQQQQQIGTRKEFGVFSIFLNGLIDLLIDWS